MLPFHSQNLRRHVYTVAVPVPVTPTLDERLVSIHVGKIPINAVPTRSQIHVAGIALMPLCGIQRALAIIPWVLQHSDNAHMYTMADGGAQCVDMPAVLGLGLDLLFDTNLIPGLGLGLGLGSGL